MSGHILAAGQLQLHQAAATQHQQAVLRWPGLANCVSWTLPGVPRDTARREHPRDSPGVCHGGHVTDCS